MDITREVSSISSSVSSAPRVEGLQSDDPKAVAAKVQSIFLEMMLKSMEDSVGTEGGGLFGGGAGSDIYAGMFREQMAAAIGNRLGGPLEAQLLKGLGSPSSGSEPGSGSTGVSPGFPVSGAPAPASVPVKVSDLTAGVAPALPSAPVRSGGTYYPRPPAHSVQASVPSVGAPAVSAAALQQSHGLPVDGVVTSEKGWRKDPITGQTQYHAGIDVAAPEGTAVKAMAAGRVIESGVKGGYGNAVVIATDDGRRMLYGHNSKNFVRVGDRVAAGDAIAAVGATGHATGPHVHFEVSEK